MMPFGNRELKRERATINSISIKSYLKYIIISTIALFLLYVLFPFYFEMGTISHFKIMASGIFSGKPQGFFNSFGTHILIDKWIAVFYSLYSGIEWYDIFIGIFHGFLLAQIILVLRLFRLGNTFSFKVLSLSVFIFVSQNFIQQDPLRLSALLCATSMILILNYRLSKILSLWIIFMFSLGLLVRIESGVLAVIFVSIAELIYKGWRNILFRQLAIFYTLLAGVLVFINLPLNQEEANYLKMRPYQFALWDYYNEYPEVKFDNQRDSIVFYSATKSFMADETKINEAFYKKVELKTADKTPKNMLNYLIKIPYQLDRVSEYFQDFILHQKLLWLYFLFTIGVIVYLYKRTLPTLFVSGVILLSLFSISILMKMEQHLFYSMISLILLLVFFYSQTTTKVSPEIANKWIFSSLLISGAFFIISIFQYIKEKSAYSKAMHLAKLELSQLDETDIVFLDLQTTIHWYSYLFEKDIPMKCTIIPMDNGLIYMTKSHQEKLKSVFGCSEFPCYMEKFLNRKNSYYLAVPDRKEIFDNYMKNVYTTSIHFEAIRTIDLKEHQLVPPISLYSVSKHSFQ